MITEDLQLLKSIGPIEYYLRPDKILVGKFTNNSPQITAENISDTLQFFKEYSLQTQKPLCILINFSALKHLPLKARHHLRSEQVKEFSPYSKGIALVIENSISKLLGNVLLSVVKGYNLKLFTQEEKAIEWLQSFD
ncbi:STAS/SEC14 domain-containing protein [Saprospira sp. CCB-QB6]|uniref:DUF7793 family protein n=1 Tax=Saprospira sp. CCB-QB6 TaxID=3023936 RepID=UPI00234A5D2A|nr:STAS/SEC14 domain-containing protein [Saprospira sp. CCB-QB6]WCL80979.1 STAS/SEC14 domain-containing protein [Saprospira sp. CCB-QB6]